MRTTKKVTKYYPAPLLSRSRSVSLLDTDVLFSVQGGRSRAIVPTARIDGVTLLLRIHRETKEHIYVSTPGFTLEGPSNWRIVKTKDTVILLRDSRLPRILKNKLDSVCC